MIRILDDLVLLKEIDTIDGLDYNSSQLKRKHPEKVIVIKRVSFIKREVLCEKANRETTDLSNYLQISELAEQLSISKLSFINRINFMEATGSKFFNYKKIAGIHFIKVDEELKQLFLNFQPFIATLRDGDIMIHCRLLGDLKIGFY